jgi:5'-3' exonuclease
MSEQSTKSKLKFKKRSDEDGAGVTSKGIIKLSKKIVEKKNMDKVENNSVVDKESKVVEKKPRASRATTSIASLPLVFIDTSYFIFYRYHATKAWYLHSKKEDDKDDLTIDNQGFVENYSKHFRQWTAKISKKFKVPESQFYWFRDSPKETVWRTPLFPAYKATRDKKCPDGIEGFFTYTYDNLIPKNRQMIVEGAEADDIAAVAAQMENANNPTQHLVIITADTDYLQLVNDVTRVVKLPNFDDIPLVVKLGKEKVTVTPKEYLVIKVILGDTADEIPKVYSGCGPSTALNISRDPDTFKRLIEDHPERLEKYQHNLTLISFDEIPAEIRQKCQLAYILVRGI